MKCYAASLALAARGRAPHGARGLKFCLAGGNEPLVRRAPHGARGLKCSVLCLRAALPQVAPRTGRVD